MPGLATVYIFALCKSWNHVNANLQWLISARWVKHCSIVRGAPICLISVYFTEMADIKRPAFQDSALLTKYFN